MQDDVTKEIAALHTGLGSVEETAVTNSQTAVSDAAEAHAAVASLREALDETDRRLSGNIDADLESMKEVRRPNDAMHSPVRTSY